ncbi:hypothetical protein ASE01_20090 [Nocardioides sp. Root190]|uniref:hypothetical protein n=1 Tax=Nocardioides sp. Root190 TaxID=1736488 RepID=UPI0006F98DF3|nr:hypothetical protein [Nocardioides sp. Root190]KRB73078.1 hypothetical protein ASE01_20090 [Nocardioides sp. Root190]
MITIEDTLKHLAENSIAGAWDDERVTAVLAAERAAQRSVLDLPSPRPAEADEALLARVVHNLTTSTSKTVERIGVQGDGVRELEQRWSRRRRAEPVEDSSPKPRRKRAAKKTAATPADTNKKENR